MDLRRRRCCKIGYASSAVYHALVIGINAVQEPAAAGDQRSTNALLLSPDLLRQKYGFPQVTLLLNPGSVPRSMHGRSTGVRGELTESDNLLTLLRRATGCWTWMVKVRRVLDVGGRRRKHPGSIAISVATITGARMRAMSAKHVMVVSDFVLHRARLTRGLNAVDQVRAQRTVCGRAARGWRAKRSRTALVSGKLSVAGLRWCERTASHSVFTRA